MANFFSSDYWAAFYFKAAGGQETAADPNALRGTFAGSSSFAGYLAATFTEAAGRKRGGKDDGRRKPKRRTYVEYTDKKIEEIRKREKLLFGDLIDEPVTAFVAAEPVPPPLPIAERKSLDYEAELNRVTGLMQASIEALSDKADRYAQEQLRKRAKAAKVEPPSKDAENRERELRAMVIWLAAREEWLRAQQQAEAEALALQQDEEDVIILLLAA